MELRRVESSAIAAVGYEAGKQCLGVLWKSEPQVYCYYGVPPVKYQELVRAESIGRYANREIRQHYLYEVTPLEDHRITI
ncbi:MAG TPA: KTSC domain-containing protein [Chloroflexota bacterium]|nr:KTSC domain-containing protein [Chloroflexota bacterium]